MPFDEQLLTGFNSNNNNNNTNRTSLAKDDQPFLPSPTLVLNPNNEVKGSMTSIVHPFFYIIFGGVIFIVVSIVLTIFIFKFIKRKYNKFKHSRSSSYHRNINGIYNRSRNRRNHSKNIDQVVLDEDQDQEQDLSQDNINFEQSQYKNNNYI